RLCFPPSRPCLLYHPLLPLRFLVSLPPRRNQAVEQEVGEEGKPSVVSWKERETPTQGNGSVCMEKTSERITQSNLKTTKKTENSSFRRMSYDLFIYLFYLLFIYWF